MPKLTKSTPKTRFDNYEKILRKKAEEVRRSMSAQKVAQVVTRLDVPSDEDVKRALRHNRDGAAAHARESAQL